VAESVIAMTKKTPTPAGIRIVSQPELKKKPEEPLLPLHVLFVSELVPLLAHQERANGLQSVDKNRFAGLMQSLSPRLRVDVPDRMSGEFANLEFELTFPDLKSFRPEGIVAQIPALKQMLKTRNLIQEVRLGALGVEEFHVQARSAGIDEDLVQRFCLALAAIPAKPPQQTPSPLPKEMSEKHKSGKLSSLLDMVDLEGGGEREPVKAFEQFVGALATEKEEPRGVNTSVARKFEEQLDQIIGDQLNAILHDPDFQRLEKAWRGLKFLVDRIDFRKEILLSVLPSQKARIQEILQEHVVNPVLDGSQPYLRESPISVVVLDYDFGGTAAEVDILSSVADDLSRINAVCITGGNAAFFGKESAGELASLEPTWQIFQRPEYARWNTFRGSDSSNSLSLCLPRFLLRASYGKDIQVKELNFVETSGGSLQGSPPDKLWGNAALAVTAALAAALSETGWPTQFSAPESGIRIENLPLTEGGPGGVWTPLETLLPLEKQVDLAESGFTVLSSRANDDAIYVGFAPTVHRPGLSGDRAESEGAHLRSTLSYQLAVCRVLQLLRTVQNEISGASEAQLRKAVVERVGGLFAAGGYRVKADSIQVKKVESSVPGQLEADITVRLPETILGKEITVTIGLHVRQ
jgi:type VI secretion system protein ImpC